MTKRAVIFDIDGTLANVEHRRVHMRGQTKDWKAWNAGMVDDTPNWPVVHMCQAYCMNPNYDVFIFSGRAEADKEGDWRQVTIDWLIRRAYLWPDDSNYRTNVMYKELHMRKEGDYRSDVVVKREMLHALQARGYQVDFTVDDRQCVVDMWREEGITCFQCAPGDFDTKGPKYEPGQLTLLVGPSGAGKSTWIKNAKASATSASGYMAPQDEVVSSDEIRATLCGDFKDQSKNDQVCAAVHAIVKTRLEHGLNVIVDATNIRARDRRKIRDQAPANTKIIYRVFNRPMDEKIRDGGWRNDVEIVKRTVVDKEAPKGDRVIRKTVTPLMARHEEVFNQNLKAILNGDDDPRVTVIDYRGDANV